MSRLNRKFLISIGVILFVIGLFSLYLNMNFFERYFLYEQKNELRNVSDTLIENSNLLEETIAEVQKKEDIAVIKIENSLENDILNQRLNEAFISEGIRLTNYWLWVEDQKEVLNKGRKIKIYNQEKFTYSLLVEYILIDNNFIAVTKIVPEIDKTLLLVNKINTIIYIGTGILLFLCISILVKRIIAPIHKIREASNAISNLDFVNIQVKTNDELELLAEDINSMSQNLKESHLMLIKKNEQMEDLLTNVSHDLKTPISLIKMYSCGLKDGIDDGSFLDTIIAQNTRMENIVEKLLNLAKLQQQEYELQNVNISEYLKKLLEEYNLKSNSLGIKFDYKIQDSIMVYTNQEAIYLIFSNVISNAIKYSKDGKVKIELYSDEFNSKFKIENTINDEIEVDIQKIWEPFYVADKSRNKNMSGTGLGLSIVKSACDKFNIKYNCDFQNNIISFEFEFKIK